MRGVAMKTFGGFFLNQKLIRPGGGWISEMNEWISEVMSIKCKLNVFGRGIKGKEICRVFFALFVVVVFSGQVGELSVFIFCLFRRF